MKQMSDDKKL